MAQHHEFPFDWFDQQDGGQYKQLENAALQVHEALVVAEKLSGVLKRSCTASDIVAIAGLLLDTQRPIDQHWEKVRKKRSAAAK